MRTEISNSVARKGVSAPGEGMFGARGMRGLALGVVVVCCSENRTSLSGFRRPQVGRANCSFRLQKLQCVSAGVGRARAKHLARGVAVICERFAGTGTV